MSPSCPAATAHLFDHHLEGLSGELKRMAQEIESLRRERDEYKQKVDAQTKELEDVRHNHVCERCRAGKTSIVFQSVSLDDSTCSTCATNRFPISALPTQSGTTAHSASDPVASHRPSPSAHSPASTGDPDSGAEQYDLPINFKDKAEWGIPSDEIILDTEIGAPPHKKRHISAECDKTSGPSSSAERNRRARKILKEKLVLAKQLSDKGEPLPPDIRLAVDKHEREKARKRAFMAKRRSQVKSGQIQSTEKQSNTPPILDNSPQPLQILLEAGPSFNTLHPCVAQSPENSLIGPIRWLFGLFQAGQTS